MHVREISCCKTFWIDTQNRKKGYTTCINGRQISCLGWNPRYSILGNVLLALNDKMLAAGFSYTSELPNTCSFWPNFSLKTHLGTGRQAMYLMIWKIYLECIHLLPVKVEWLCSCYLVCKISSWFSVLLVNFLSYKRRISVIFCVFLFFIFLVKLNHWNVLWAFIKVLPMLQERRE